QVRRAVGDVAHPANGAVQGAEDRVGGVVVVGDDPQAGVGHAGEPAGRRPRAVAGDVGVSVHHVRRGGAARGDDRLGVVLVQVGQLPESVVQHLLLVLHGAAIITGLLEWATGPVEAVAEARDAVRIGMYSSMP